MDFEAYLQSKKIDSVRFKGEESARWHDWKDLFDQVSPASFTAQKLFLLNRIRRKYPAPEEIQKTPEPPASAPPRPNKPVFKPKIS